MKWLHLSDIHFTDFGYSTEVLRESLIQTLERLDLKLDFIIITGDCFFQNISESNIIPELKEFIITIGKKCHVDKSRIYLCQGNHDIDRTNSKRNKIIDQLRGEKDFSTEAYNSLITIGNENYRSLFRAIKPNKEYVDYEVIESKKHDARIVSINSCLLSKDKEDYHKLRVCTPRLEKIQKRIKDDDKLNIVIMHHGIDWLHPSDGRSFEHWVEDHFIDAVFVGHTHQPNVVSLNDVNREIVQFTSGALVIDGYTIPGFYICEEEKGCLTVTLYTFSEKTERWDIDNHNLRKFKASGKHTFLIPRREKKEDSKVSGINKGANIPDSNGLSCEKLIEALNTKYQNKYGSKSFYSEKSGDYEDFNAWVIVGSLANASIPYPTALRLVEKIVDVVTSDKYPSDNLIKSGVIKEIVYNTILRCYILLPNISEYQAGIWASMYARHYDKNTGIVMIYEGKEIPISFSQLRNDILKDVIVGITGNEVYYQKIFTNELEKVCEELMRFIKRLGIVRIKRDILIDMLTEYVSELPHPWFVRNNREFLIKYHKENADKHLHELINNRNKKALNPPVLQIEAAYHLFAAYLAIYDDYTGCSETSPISIMQNALANLCGDSDKAWPVRKCMLIQMREDLKTSNVDVLHFKKLVGIVYRNIVERKEVSRNDTLDALLEIRRILKNIPINVKEEWVKTGDPVHDIMRIFINARGIIVRKPIRQLNGNAFVIAPYWDDYQKQQYNLGEDMLVYMLDSGTLSIESINSYYNRSRNHQEIVFFKDDFGSFSNEERKRVRQDLEEKNINVRCVFIQEENFKYISKNGWRNEFFHVVTISKPSIW